MKPSLEVRQDKAIAALLYSTTLKEAAKSCKIGESTLLRWLKEDEAFNNRYRKTRLEAIRHSSITLQQHANIASQVLIEIATNQDTHPTARISAAKSILDFAYRSAEVDDVDARLTALENGTCKTL